jgi:hypothetical protein
MPTARDDCRGASAYGDAIASKLLDAQTVYEQARQEQSRNGAAPLRRRCEAASPVGEAAPEIRDAMIQLRQAGLDRGRRLGPGPQ